MFHVLDVTSMNYLSLTKAQLSRAFLREMKYCGILVHALFGYIHASSVHRTKGASRECNFEVGYLKELLKGPNSCKAQDRQKTISFQSSFQNTDFPLSDSLVFVCSLLNPYVRCIPGIKDTQYDRIKAS